MYLKRRGDIEENAPHTLGSGTETYHSHTPMDVGETYAMSVIHDASIIRKGQLFSPNHGCSVASLL